MQGEEEVEWTCHGLLLVGEGGVNPNWLLFGVKIEGCKSE